MTLKIKQKILKSNGRFSIIKDKYHKYQHPNQQDGLDMYVNVLDHCTGNINSLKLHKNSKGLYFKKAGFWHLSKFTQEYLHIPYQIIKVSNIFGNQLTESLQHAIDNGYDLYEWSAIDIAIDIATYDSDYEGVEPLDLEPHIQKWLDKANK